MRVQPYVDAPLSQAVTSRGNMNNNISSLNRLAQKPERFVIGLMSGTSLDGLDVALCRIGGAGGGTTVEVIEFDTVEYNDDYRQRVLSVFSRRDADLETVCVLNAWIGLEHADIVLACLERWQRSPADVDLVASHGQTIYHAPTHFHGRPEYPNATLQIGDGDHLSRRTGIITISDFRQKHLAAGGEGAPLAVYGDYLIYSDAEENRILLNIGGIANLTWLPRGQDPAEVMSTDVGPGNTMMDALVQARYPGRRYDQDSALARRGRVSAALLEALQSNRFFDMPFPKTIGPELFNMNYLSAAQAASNTRRPVHRGSARDALSLFRRRCYGGDSARCRGQIRRHGVCQRRRHSQWTPDRQHPQSTRAHRHSLHAKAGCRSGRQGGRGFCRPGQRVRRRKRHWARRYGEQRRHRHARQAQLPVVG